MMGWGTWGTRIRWIGRAGCLVAVTGGFVLVSGCRLSGDWRTVEVVPHEGRDDPTLSAISFTWDGRYTATERRHLEQVTSTGRYRWNGLRLTLVPKGDVARTYPCVRKLDGSLMLRYRPSVTTTLRPSRSSE